MGSPDRSGAHDCEVPRDDKAICVASHEALVGKYKGGSVHLGLMAAQDELGLGWTRLGRHILIRDCVMMEGGRRIDL
jgi:hypothetical protein